MARQWDQGASADPRRIGRRPLSFRRFPRQIRRSDPDRTPPAVRKRDDDKDRTPPRSLRQDRKPLAKKRMLPINDRYVIHHPFEDWGIL
jgi:hypothetical protein